MEKVKNRYIVAIVLIFLTGLIVRVLNYGSTLNAEGAVETVQKIPLQINGWRGVDVELEENVYEILDTRAIIHRNYSLNKTKVFLSIVYYPETKVDFHAPEACLGGLGQKTQKQQKRITLYYNETINVDLNEIIQTQGDKKTLVYYFYKAGDYMGGNYLVLRLSLAYNKFFLNNKSGALIRVSTPIIDGDNSLGSIKLIEFLEDLYPYLVNYL